MCLALGPRRSWSDLRALAVAATAAGWDALRCIDAPRPAAECWTLAGALAEVTEVEIQVVVDQGRGRHPAVVAKEAATADRLHRGRLLLGLRPTATRSWSTPWR